MVRIKKELPYEKATIIGAKAGRKWCDTDIPIFSVTSSHELNQLVGYVMFINGANGTVLYRGQNNLYENMEPSGARQNCQAVEISLIKKIAADKNLHGFFKLDNPEIAGWEKYQEIVIEAALQHYGANTYCMDFVDNHWCALWFGLNKFNYDGTYTKRTDADGFLYLILYLADTNGSAVHGLYIGEETYTIDLRKSLPSYFLRSASQHGWIVRGKERKVNNFKENVLCVIEIKVKDASKWLGDGLLLSQSNFFPDYTIDQGYNTLLLRQDRSGVYNPRYDMLLPSKTIQNYHYRKGFYCSNESKNPTPKNIAYYISGKKKNLLESVVNLYALLLEKGWSQRSCEKASNWNPRNPCVSQSASTALLVQKIFGGEIFKYYRKPRWHYFNRIDEDYYDLTSGEYTTHLYDKYESCTNVGIPKKKKYYIEERERILIKDIGLVFDNQE